MSDQWGQPYQPQQPQNPYGQQPQGPYNQPPNPYGQPVQQPQGPYGEAPQPGPYGPGQPQGPYGQPQPTPFGQPPTMQPPMQPITPQNPYGQQYGFPQQPAPPAGNKNRNMVISGAVVLVLIVAAVVFFATKGSGSHPGSGNVNASATGTGVASSGTIGAQTQAQSCAAVKSLKSTMDSQDPNSEADTISALAQDVPQMQTIADDAQSGTFKTQMQKLATDFNALESYMKANPGLDTSSETPPTQFVSIAESIDADLSAVDTTCGISDDSDSGSGDSGF